MPSEQRGRAAAVCPCDALIGYEAPGVEDIARHVGQHRFVASPQGRHSSTSRYYMNAASKDSRQHTAA